MPQFILVELPSFRLKTLEGQPVALASKHVALFSSLYQYVRGGLATAAATTSAAGGATPELCASLLFAGGEPGTWTSSTSAATGLHAEEALLADYFASFAAPGAYPIVDALLMSHKPCSSCLPYFSQSGKTLRCSPSSSLSPSSGGNSSSSSRSGGASFRARFTPRSDRSYTPIFYLARSLDPVERGGLWLEMASLWASNTLFPPATTALYDDEQVASGMVRGQMYWLIPGSGWFAVCGQEGMTDGEVVQMVAQQGGSMGYWIGR
ncbi:hypothetical protein MN608_01736 [Microdochium nivale]|nr:hypothetical protein MN608_01736 [Microdochium nivale]